MSFLRHTILGEVTEEQLKRVVSVTSNTHRRHLLVNAIYPLSKGLTFALPPPHTPFSSQLVKRLGLRLSGGFITDYNGNKIQPAGETWEEWDEFRTSCSYSLPRRLPDCPLTPSQALSALDRARHLRVHSMSLNNKTKRLVWNLPGFPLTAKKFTPIRAPRRLLLHYGAGTAGATTRFNYSSISTIEIDPLTPYGATMKHSDYQLPGASGGEVVISDISAVVDSEDHGRSMDPRVTNIVVADLIENHPDCVFFEAKIGLADVYPPQFDRWRWAWRKPRLHNAEIIVTRDPEGIEMSDVMQNAAILVERGNRLRMAVFAGASPYPVLTYESPEYIDFLLDADVPKPPVMKFSPRTDKIAIPDEF